MSKTNHILQRMVGANMPLYERILDTEGFAFHFNELLKHSAEQEREAERLKDAYSKSLQVLKGVSRIQEAHEAGTRCLCALCKIELPTWKVSDE